MNTSGLIVPGDTGLPTLVATINRGYGCWKRVSVEGLIETGNFSSTETREHKSEVADAILSDLFWDTSLSYVTHMADSCTHLEWIHRGRLFDHED